MRDLGWARVDWRRRRRQLEVRDGDGEEDFQRPALWALLFLFCYLCTCEWREVVFREDHLAGGSRLSSGNKLELARINWPWYVSI
jgi:hypothetical protein